MEDRKIMIKSTTKGTINLYDPYNRLDISWEKKGAKKSMSLEKLQECIWTPGVANLFTDGYLVIDDPDAFKIMQELGLEDPTSDEPTLMILDDTQRKRIMTTAPLAEFKETFKKMNYEQRQLLADFAIENKCTDFDRCMIIKDAVGTDVLTAIRLHADMENDNEKEA